MHSLDGVIPQIWNGMYDKYQEIINIFKCSIWLSCQLNSFYYFIRLLNSKQPKLAISPTTTDKRLFSIRSFFSRFIKIDLYKLFYDCELFWYCCCLFVFWNVGSLWTHTKSFEKCDWQQECTIYFVCQCNFRWLTFDSNDAIVGR